MENRGPLIQLLGTRRKAVVTEELEREHEEMGASHPQKKLVSDTIAELKSKDSAICFPLIAQDHLIGVFHLGEKKSGDMYTDEDINLISSICHQMTIAIENQRLQEEALVAQQQVMRADKMITAGTIAASYAHDMRNPLAAVKGLAQALSLSDDPDPETIEKIKKLVPEQIDKLEQMINHILGFVRSQPMKNDIVDLCGIVEEVVQLLAIQANKSDVTVACNFQKEAIFVLGQSDLLSQAFTNMALNAIQAMPGGGKLTFSVSQESEQVRVRITDTGIGIPQESLSRIFTPFFTTKETGVGLGLSIVQRIVNEHGGHLRVHSEVGKGTTFEVEMEVLNAPRIFL